MQFNNYGSIFFAHIVLRENGSVANVRATSNVDQKKFCSESDYEKKTRLISYAPTPKHNANQPTKAPR
jgi:hypothetical protein